MTLAVERQAIVRSGPHPFRSVDFKMTNVGTRPVYVYGNVRGDTFEPAGDRLVRDPQTKEWMAGTARGRGLDPEAVRREFKKIHVLGPGHSLLFNRAYAPDIRGLTIKADVYCTLDRSAVPVRVTTDAFVVN